MRMGGKILMVALLALLSAQCVHASGLNILSVDVEPISIAQNGSADIVVVVRNSDYSAAHSGTIALEDPEAGGALSFPAATSTGAVNGGESMAATFPVLAASDAETKNYALKITVSEGSAVVDSATAYLNVNPTGEGPAQVPEIPFWLALAVAGIVLAVMLLGR